MNGFHHDVVGPNGQALPSTGTSSPAWWAHARKLTGITLRAALVLMLVLWPAFVQAQSGSEASSAAGANTSTDVIPQRNLMQIIKAGGILMIPIIFCSFITLVFVFERAVALRRGRVIPRPFIKRFLHQLSEGQLDKEQALKLCDENGSPVAQVFAGAVKKWGRPAVEVEQAMLDAGERASNGLRKYIRVFNAVSTISPLLGLLGTVFGMIRAFNDIAGSNAMGKAEQLARGISEALITTAAGLLIAIPALVCYLYFLSRVDQLVMEIDALGQEVVSAISAEALQAAAKPTRSRSREPA
ncbi:MAG TPA: MotA/TolQ/ExbB proton channel family protein [Pirellulales bacterium]|nr:MotA/TolQ/ExbB proton channel family protein [Pirellulales bacterium]